MGKDKTKGAFGSLHKQVETQDRLDAPYERALGKLSIRFSLLHSLLEQFGWEIWSMNAHLAPILTRDLPTKQLVKKLRDSSEFVIPKEEDLKEFLSILTRAEKAAGRKVDELAHAEILIWTPPL